MWLLGSIIVLLLVWLIIVNDRLIDAAFERIRKVWRS